MVVSPNLVKRQKQHFNVLDTLGVYNTPLNYSLALSFLDILCCGCNIAAFPVHRRQHHPWLQWHDLGRAPKAAAGQWQQRHGT